MEKSNVYTIKCRNAYFKKLGEDGMPIFSFSICDAALFPRREVAARFMAVIDCIQKMIEDNPPPIGICTKVISDPQDHAE